MGEAWLNFSYFGPFLVGLFAAIIIKYFDTTPRGLFYWVMLMMVFRFFRTDTASLFKSWFVVQGGTILIVLISLKFIWDLRELLKVERQSKGYTAND